MSIVMDANALMMPVECDVRVFEELERLLAAGSLDAGGDAGAGRSGATTPADADGSSSGAAMADGDTADGDTADGDTADGDTADGDTVDAAADAGHDFLVPRAVVAELERLAGGAGEAATAAGVGLDLARERCRVVDHAADNGDAAVYECATREGVTHAVTNDSALKRRLRDAGVPVISLRGSNKLGVTHP